MLTFYTVRAALRNLKRVRSVFTPREWWFYLLVFVLVLPIGEYMYIGPRYFSEWPPFLVGTVLGTCIYWASMWCYTLIIRRMVRLYPNPEQVPKRMLITFLLLISLVPIMTVVNLWLFSVTPYTGSRLSWESVVPPVEFGVLFMALLSTALGLFYVYEQWQERQIENEQLKRQSIQQQYDALKGQVNPHFLFNSLNSIQALIGEDTSQAERVVDSLAGVYRYMLRVNSQELVLLTDELAFLRPYAYLLAVRFGNRLRIDLPALSPDVSGSIPALSLQTLIDNALKHNSMSEGQPLHIVVSLTDDSVSVANTLRQKSRGLDPTPSRLANLLAKYRQLTARLVRIDEDNDMFCVTLPLLQPTPAERTPDASGFLGRSD